MNKNLLLFLCLIYSCLAFAANVQFKPQVGDLYFQDLACGTLCKGIGKVTEGVNHTSMSHVGMIVDVSGKEPLIIQAVDAGVIETPLNKFLARSLDNNHKPRVVVGRLKPQYRYLIPGAVNFAKAQLGKPYNATFVKSSGQKYYCSELIYDAFKAANNNQPFFHMYPMNFNNLQTNQPVKEWQEYYSALHSKIPQGLPGINPGGLSRESSIAIVHWYGKLNHS